MLCCSVANQQDRKMEEYKGTRSYWSLRQKVVPTSFICMMKKKIRVSKNHSKLPLINELEGARFLFSDFFSFSVDTADAWKPESLCFCPKFYLARICISKSLQSSYPQKAYSVLWIIKLYVWQILVKDDRGPEPLRTKLDTEDWVGHRTDLTASWQYKAHMW